MNTLLLVLFLIAPFFVLGAVITVLIVAIGGATK